MKTTIALALVTLALGSAAAQASQKEAALAKDVRSWVHTKSMVIPDKSHGLYGFHNIYANPRALKPLKAGGTYKNGSILVVRFHEVVDQGGMIIQGALKMDAVMVKSKKGKDTGGWLWLAFGPDGKPMKIDPVKDCYNCHLEGAKTTDYVFSKYVE
jgi:hypothetical protein